MNGFVQLQDENNIFVIFEDFLQFDDMRVRDLTKNIDFSVNNLLFVLVIFRCSLHDLQRIVLAVLLASSQFHHRERSPAMRVSVTFSGRD